MINLKAYSLNIYIYMNKYLFTYFCSYLQTAGQYSVFDNHFARTHGPAQTGILL